MAVVIADGDVGATGTYVAGGITEVICNGDFENATVDISVQSDGSESAPAYSFWGPGAISIQSAPGTSIIATVVGAGPASIDVSANP